MVLKITKASSNIHILRKVKMNTIFLGAIFLWVFSHRFDKPVNLQKNQLIYEIQYEHQKNKRLCLL